MSNPFDAETLAEMPDQTGHFGPYGGRFVSETLMHVLLGLQKKYEELRDSLKMGGSFKNQVILQDRMRTAIQDQKTVDRVDISTPGFLIGINKYLIIIVSSVFNSS